MADQQEQIKEDLQKYSHLLKQFSADYRSDEKLRARIDGGDAAPLFKALNPDVPGGMNVPEGIQVRVVADTDQVQHMVIPSNPTWMMQDSDMQNISGGSTAGSASSVGSAGCFLCVCVPSTVSSAGTAGCAGSAAV